MIEHLHNIIHHRGSDIIVQVMIDEKWLQQPKKKYIYPMYTYPRMWRRLCRLAWPSYVCTRRIYMRGYTTEYVEHSFGDGTRLNGGHRLLGSALCWGLQSQSASLLQCQQHLGRPWLPAHSRMLFLCVTGYIEPIYFDDIYNCSHSVSEYN